MIGARLLAASAAAADASLLSPRPPPLPQLLLSPFLSLRFTFSINPAVCGNGGQLYNSPPFEMGKAHRDHLRAETPHP